MFEILIAPFAAIGLMWSILIGVFFVAMVIGCTYDRRQAEEAKWIIFVIGLALYGLYAWNHDYKFSLSAILNSEIWKVIGIYLAIGLGYSMVEFMLDVRRSARYWSQAWASFKVNFVPREKEIAPEDLANVFVSRHPAYRRIVGVAVNDKPEGSDDLVIPKINRGELAEGIGCWMIFWPFYMVSLIIGDLLMEVARIVADIFAHISGRFVRVAFKNVFKFN